jgi:hypothetical protein
MEKDLENKYGPESNMRKIVEQCLTNDCFFYKNMGTCGAVEKNKTAVAQKCKDVFCNCYMNFNTCDFLKQYIGMTRDEYERNPAPAWVLWPEMPTVVIEFSFRTPPGIYEKTADGKRHIYRLPSLQRAIELVEAVTEPQHVQAFLKIAGGHRFLPRYDRATGKIIEMRPGGVPLYVGSTLTGIAGYGTSHGHRRGGGGGGGDFDTVIEDARKFFGSGSSSTSSETSEVGLLEEGSSSSSIEMSGEATGLLGLG